MSYFGEGGGSILEEGAVSPGQYQVESSIKYQNKLTSHTSFSALPSICHQSLMHSQRCKTILDVTTCLKPWSEGNRGSSLSHCELQSGKEWLCEEK